MVGSVRVPLNSSDFSFLLQALSSKVKIVGLAIAGQIDLPVCECNMPWKKTELREYEIIRPGCFRPRRLLSHGRVQAVVDHTGLSTTCPI